MNSDLSPTALAKICPTVVFFVGTCKQTSNLDPSDPEQDEAVTKDE